MQIYVYYSSSSANVAYAAYSACAGPGYSCGPEYYCPFGICPVQSITIASGATTDIGKASDSVRIKIYWNTGINAYVYDYQDTANNPSWWTVLDVYPTGTYSTMAGNGASVGYCGSGSAGTGCALANSPVYYAYFFQVGFTFGGTIPTSRWTMNAVDTTYGLVGQPSSSTYLNHAQTMVCGSNSGELPAYYSYWKEVWAVSGTPASFPGVGSNGGGSSSANDLWAFYNGQGSCNGNELKLW